MLAKTILVVDDQSVVRNKLRNILEPVGHTILEAVDGGDGLNLARNNDAIDLIITDMNMPNMSGLELIEEVRMLPLHTKTPIFVLTTEGSPVVSGRGRQAGATAWIIKPVNKNLLIQGIEYWFARDGR
ncbi:MAG: response regulator [Myxococcota bacterium]|nr:response regulator [Myxococcota bacterium]